jgi:hypothetical protein
MLDQRRAFRRRLEERRALRRAFDKAVRRKPRARRTLSRARSKRHPSGRALRERNHRRCIGTLLAITNPLGASSRG